MNAVEREIALDFDGPVGRLRIDRPAARNALSCAHWEALGVALDQAVCANVRVLWLHGVGGSFSAGADIAELRAQCADHAALLANAEQVQAVLCRLESAPMMTLSLIDGACTGGGLGLALACDLRLATPTSRFALAPARLGLRYSPRDCRRLANVIGLARAREMLLTGCTLSADRALTWGLVGELVESDRLLWRAEEISKQLLNSSADALLGMKQTLALLGGDQTQTEEALWCGFRGAFSSTDFAEGVAAFLDKRAPQFSKAQETP